MGHLRTSTSSLGALIFGAGVTNCEMAMSQSAFSAGAVAAAMKVAQCLRVGRVHPVVLHTSQHVTIRLLPTDLVARAVRDDAQSLDRLRRELSVGQHLSARGAPSVGLAAGVPPGPHFSDGFAVTFWEFVSHVPANEDNAEHTARAAAALSRVHQALADFPFELPNFWAKVDQCRNLLQTPSALPELAPGNRQFLLSVYSSVRTALDRLPVRLLPILGDAHLGNVFITSDGALWNDFEDACLGPREWDIGFLPEPELGAFEPLNRDALVELGYLRSLCVSVWCWALAHIPEKREAAEYHLGYLRERASAGQLP
jgi:Phosphotransferase enzyme family